MTSCGTYPIAPGQVFIASFLNVKIVRGGDPLNAVRIMASAKYLLMSRSALSFAGGIMNRNGKVYYPERLGRKPMKDWISFNSPIEISELNNFDH